MSEDLPKQDMLAKLLRMTTSPNDGEALTAIRKANNLLTSNGWDWDKLLAGKIRIAADPFANLGTPHNPSANRDDPRVHNPAPPPRPQASPQPSRRPQTPPPPPRQPAPPPPPFEPYSHRSTNGQSNIYPGNCYCCGHTVSAKAGKLFVPHDFNKRAPAGKKPICNSCDQNRHAYIDSKPAPQPKAYSGPIRAPSASEL